jgi:hypothetical protein
MRVVPLLCLLFLALSTLTKDATAQKEEPQTAPTKTRLSIENEKIETNKKAVFQRFRNTATQNISIPFVGQNDTGEIGTPQVTPNPQVTILKEPLPQSQISDGAYPNPTIREGTTQETLTELAFDLLNTKFPGWEIGQGSEGTIEIDIPNEKIKILLTEYSQTSTRLTKEL